MPAAKKGRATTRQKSAKAVHASTDVWARTQLLVEVLLRVMEHEIAAEQPTRSEQWLKLFGPKDSAVVNLQKLVQLLAELQEQSPVKMAPDARVTPVSESELGLLHDWLKTSAANVSQAAE